MVASFETVENLNKNLKQHNIYIYDLRKVKELPKVLKKFFEVGLGLVRWVWIKLYVTIFQSLIFRNVTFFLKRFYSFD